MHQHFCQHDKIKLKTKTELSVREVPQSNGMIEKYTNYFTHTTGAVQKE